GGPGRDANAGVARERERRQLIFFGRCGDAADAKSKLPAPAVIADTTPEEIATQLSGMADQARRNGRAIAISPANEATLATLNELLPAWQADQVDVVPPSGQHRPGTLPRR